MAKNLIIASKIGVSNDADVFSALIFIPDSILVLVGIDSLRGVVNSEYSALYSKGNINEISESFNNLFKLIFFISLPLLTLIILFNDEVISVMLPGFTGMKKEIALSLSYFILPIFLFKAVGGLIQSLYNSTKSFFMPVILTSLISISMIVSIFLPYYKGNIIFNLAVSNLIGNMLVVSFMFLNFKKFNIRLQFKLPEFDAITKKIFKSCGSITILVLFNQIFLSSRNFFSSYYGEGAISSLTYSSAITAFITTLTFNSVFSVLLSNLSSYHSENNIEGMKVLFSKTIEIILFIFIRFLFFSYYLMLISSKYFTSEEILIITLYLK